MDTLVTHKGLCTCGMHTPLRLFLRDWAYQIHNLNKLGYLILGHLKTYMPKQKGEETKKQNTRKGEAKVEQRLRPSRKAQA